MEKAGSKQRPKVGLALSGGGARGFAHIGVLKVLHREGIPIDFLAATSMGGVIAAGYAAGLDPDFMAEEACKIGRFRNILSLLDFSCPRAGLLKGERVRSYFARHVGEMTFSELKIPLALVAVDLDTGQEVTLREGRVADAVRATVSLPGIFAPAIYDGRRLVDGGILNDLPADVARKMGADVVIAVDVSSGLHGPSPFPAMERWLLMPGFIPEAGEALWRAAMIMIEEINEYKLSQARPEVLIRPALEGIGIFGGFRRAQEAISAGEEAATSALPKIKEALM